MDITAEQFKEAFQAAFVVNRKHLVWNNKPRRTALMTAYIHRTISDSFIENNLEYEHKDIDAVLLSTESSGCKIKVAIEHENDVKTIRTELEHLFELRCPLSVLITYTGLRNEYIIERNRDILERFDKDSLLLVLSKEDWSPDFHKLGEAIPWEFFTYSSGELIPL